jgi:hypothetical protein
VEEIAELIRQYHLEEDSEYVIIPLSDKNGKVRRCYILKRRFIRILYPDGHFADYPLGEIIEATVKYPELPLSESMKFVHKEPDVQIPGGSGDEGQSEA